MKMEQCSETSAYKIQTPGNYPEESIKHSEHGESLKSIKRSYKFRFKQVIFEEKSSTKEKKIKDVWKLKYTYSSI